MCTRNMVFLLLPLMGQCVHTCFVLFASSAGLLDRLAPAALLLSAGRNSLGRSNRSIWSLGKPLYLEDEKYDCCKSSKIHRYIRFPMLNKKKKKRTVMVKQNVYLLKFKKSYMYRGVGSGPSSAGGSGGMTKTVCSLFWDSSSSNSLVSSDDSPSTCSEDHIQSIIDMENSVLGFLKSKLCSQFPLSWQKVQNYKHFTIYYTFPII